MASTLDRVAYEAGRILKFVAAMVAQDDGPRAFINSLGWELPPGVDDLGLAALDLTAVVTKFDALDEAISTDTDEVTVAAKFADLLDEVIRTVQAVRSTVAGFQATGDYLDKTQIKTRVPAAPERPDDRVATFGNVARDVLRAAVLRRD